MPAAIAITRGRWPLSPAIRTPGTSPPAPDHSRPTAAEIRRRISMPGAAVSGARSRADSRSRYPAMPYALVATDAHLYAGLADGQLLGSTDRGETWNACTL